MIKVVVCGAYGKMGRAVLNAVHNDSDLMLVGAVDVMSKGDDIGSLIGIDKIGINVKKDLQEVLTETSADVVVDFTNPNVVMNNIRIILKNRVYPVVGTTGLTDENKKEIEQLCKENNVGAFIAPNFAIGAVLMMKLSQEVAKYMPDVEIIELHHDQKLDAPSGTALRTAELISEVRGMRTQGHPDEVEKIKGARGSDFDGIHIHSVRLPGYVAHQEVIFGGLGQTLTIRHDSINRDSFMPGVVIACKKVVSLDTLVCGLENILN
ncbi:4-hydroxy-tetrahydrodipicolinate reductase [Anaerosinus sp.]